MSGDALLEVVWSGSMQRSGRCPGLSSYRRTAKPHRDPDDIDLRPEVAVAAALIDRLEFNGFKVRSPRPGVLLVTPALLLAASDRAAIARWRDHMLAIVRKGSGHAD